MKAFFALIPDPDSCMTIANWRDRALPPFEHPVPPANLHITLAFLGEIQPWHFEPLVIRGSETGFAPFFLQLNRMGYWSKAGVAWLGPAGQPAELENLAHKLAVIAGSLGLAQDKRPYHGHLTLARKVRQPPPAPAIEPDFPLSFTSFALMRTRQGKRGVHYQILEEFPS